MRQELRQIHILLGAWLQIHTDVSKICKKPKNNVLFCNSAQAQCIDIVRCLGQEISYEKSMYII